MKLNRRLIATFILVSMLPFGCQPVITEEIIPTNELTVMVVESFLADIVKNVAGDRVQVEILIPSGTDPHSFEATPRDVALISTADALVLNGAGYEERLQETLQNTTGSQFVIEASEGLTARVPVGGKEEGEPDPHFWLDPMMTVRYVENIREGLIELDPDGRKEYTQNAESYIVQLNELDRWIAQQIETIPTGQRLLVTNHDSFGYFAARYGFQVVGTVIPSVSSSASPSAQQMAELVDSIRQAGVKGIFLETSANPELAEQIARETNIRVVAGLYSDSLSPEDGEAATYLDMMKYNTRLIVEALK